MTLEFGLWRVSDGGPAKIAPSALALESQLEDFIEADPSLLGEPLLVIGRQVRTQHGGLIDLLAVDADGAVHVIELKREKTPRDVVAQILDYGSWVAKLDRSEVLSIFKDYKPGTAFDTAFVEAFGTETPDELNGRQQFTVVASAVDPATERIIQFLNEDYDVPVNVAFFRHFDDPPHSYLARTWLVSRDAEVSSTLSTRSTRTREPWNGRDWYVSFGQESGSRAWVDARKYGFVSAGGGAWYSRSLKNLPIGGRVFVCIPATGYVGVGRVSGPPSPFEEAVVEIDGETRQLASLPLEGTYRHSEGPDSEETAEWVVPVEWIATVPASEAIWQTGMFANQNSACKLSKQFTIETVTRELGISDDE